MTTQEIIDVIKGMTVLELNDLASKEEAEDIKTKIEAEGAKVTLK